MGDLAHYCSLARGQRGRAVTAVLSEVLSDPHIFVFGELFEVPSVADLATKGDKDEKAAYDQLQIFAHGTLTDYQKRERELPKLKEPQLHKLKQLTLVSLAAQSRILKYDDLLRSLDINDVRELEDVIIDTITNDLLNAKIDQARRQVEVLDVIGRDVRKEEIGKMVEQLNGWFADSSAVMQTLDELIKEAESEKEKKTEHAKSLAASIAAQRAVVKKELAEEGGGASAGGGRPGSGGYGYGAGARDDYDLDPFGGGDFSGDFLGGGRQGGKKRFGHSGAGSRY
eukprot:TRINITY_DN46893_c0_g1_i1.p1 TRINITY_DN46893_c0_g1~~TRINITY_DN46893_c0_g1_i1.p1  ORF type:complete len:284 (+),score=119.92 TRINITY_DN46893_c0_g1_i1:91-942(+)